MCVYVCLEYSNFVCFGGFVSDAIYESMSLPAAMHQNVALIEFYDISRRYFLKNFNWPGPLFLFFSPSPSPFFFYTCNEHSASREWQRYRIPKSLVVKKNKIKKHEKFVLWVFVAVARNRKSWAPSTGRGEGEVLCEKRALEEGNKRRLCGLSSVISTVRP